MVRKLYILIIFLFFVGVNTSFADGSIGTSSTGNISITVIIPASVKVQEEKEDIQIKTNYSENFRVTRKEVSNYKVIKECIHQQSCKVPKSQKQTVYIVEPQ